MCAVDTGEVRRVVVEPLHQPHHVAGDQRPCRRPDPFLRGPGRRSYRDPWQQPRAQPARRGRPTWSILQRNQDRRETEVECWRSRMCCARRLPEFMDGIPLVRRVYSWFYPGLLLVATFYQWNLMYFHWSVISRAHVWVFRHVCSACVQLVPVVACMPTGLATCFVSFRFSYLLYRTVVFFNRNWWGGSLFLFKIS